MDYRILDEVLMLLVAAVMLLTLFRRLSLPSVLAYLAVGLIAGPSGFGLVPGEDQALLAEFGVVFLLFTLGLEFSLARMTAMKWQVFGLGGLQVAVTTALFAAAAVWFGAGPGLAVVVGGALALSSTAMVVKQLSDQLELNRAHGLLATGILLFQDLAAVPLLVLIPLLGSDGAAWQGGEIVLALFQGVLVVLVVLSAGRWLLRPLFHEIARAHSPELFTLAVLLVAVGAAWLTHVAGLSLALGAFLAGMMLSETEYRHQVEADVRPIRDVFLGLFFVTVGMGLDVRILVQELSALAGLVVVLILGKTLVTGILAAPFARDRRVAVRSALAVAQGGEFGLALITLATGQALLNPAVAQILLAALVLSMLVSALVIRSNAELTRWLARDSRPVPELAQEEIGTRSLAEREHVIICGFGRVGQNVARLLEEEGFEYLALDLDPERVRRAREAGDPVFFGDAAKAEVLLGTGLDRASVVVIAFSDPLYANRIVEIVRKYRSDVPVLVRTPDDAYLELLERSGATAVVPEAMEASLILSAEVLGLLSVPLPRIIRRIEEVRSHRYRELRNLIPKSAARPPDATHALREQLGTVVLPPGAWAVGRPLAEAVPPESGLTVTAVRRHGITGREPAPDTPLREEDVVVLYGTPEALEKIERRLLSG